MSDKLKGFIDLLVNEQNIDHSKADSLLNEFITEKMKILLKADTKARELIKLDGDNVLVQGKKVGFIYHNEEDDKVQFKPLEGDKVNFPNLKTLFRHLSDKYELEKV